MAIRLRVLEAVTPIISIGRRGKEKEDLTGGQRILRKGKYVFFKLILLWNLKEN